MKCLTTDRRRTDRLPAVPRRAPPPDPAFQLHRAHLRRDPPPGQGHRPAPRRDQLPHPGLGRPGPRQPRLARRQHHDPAACGCCRTCAARCSNHPPAAATHRHRQPARRSPRNCQQPSPNLTMKPEPRPPIYTGFRTPPKAVAVGQVSSLKMVVQFLILPAGFGRFFPRWQMVRKRTFIAEPTSGNNRGVGPRRGTRHTSTVNPSCVNFSETDLRMR